MPQLNLTDEQVTDLIQQLPPEQKRALLLAIATEAQALRETRMQRAEESLRRIATERGLDWESMTENEREQLVDDLVHEERACP